MKAEHVNMIAEEYHAHPAIGASMLEDFRESRREYYAIYVARSRPPRPATTAMDLGTLIHCRLLEPDRYDSIIAPEPPELAPDGKRWLRRKGSDHERWWAEYMATTAGKIVADAAMRETVERAVEAVRNNEWASKLLSQENGQSEFSIFWTDEETQLPPKCRVDYFAPIIVDIKSTQDTAPAVFSTIAAKLGYHRRKAHYVAGLSSYLGRERFPFVHLAVATEPPFAVASYDLDDSDGRGSSLGHRQWRQTLRELANCLKGGDWRDLQETQVNRIRLPGWAFAEDSYRIGETT